DPSVIVGTRVNRWNSNARVGKSQWLIFEADEYREAFLNLNPYGLIITSIDYDHPDYYPTKSSYYRAFKRLISKVDKRGFVIGFGDDVEVRAALKFAKAKKLKTLSYGFLKRNDLCLSDKGVFRAKQVFHALFHKKKTSKGSLLFAGKHNILNAGAALLAANMLKVSMPRALRALSTFPGTARRFEVLKTYKNQSKLIDDYAHHPNEIKASLQGARALYPRHRLIAVFQPHMFSRTKILLEDFAKAFSEADEVVIMEIYPSAREKKRDFKVSSKNLVAAIRQYHRKVSLQKSRAGAKQKVLKELKQGKTIGLLLGAGDLNYLI
ncbi:MAG: cyanophycin synthetase, partial [Candidatus Harrisonbacteria bacterium]|nr:cyanophycin synthetase [Candidatus Harrisonbacteria bacterium]